MGFQDRRAADQDRLVRLARFDPAADLDARQPGNVEVDDHQVERSRIAESLDPSHAVLGLDDLKTLHAEEQGDQTAKPSFVLNEQQPTAP